MAASLCLTCKEPAFARGDLLFLTLEKSPVYIGEIVVFKIKGKDIPIVHRVLEIHTDAKTGKDYLLTKGDNNKIDDRGLYNQGISPFWYNFRRVDAPARALSL